MHEAETLIAEAHLHRAIESSRVYVTRSANRTDQFLSPSLTARRATTAKSGAT